jgi:hypothetical protein
MFGLGRKRHLAQLSSGELLRCAYALGWSATKACGGFVLTNRYHSGAVASAAMSGRALRELLIDLIQRGHEAPP